MRSPVHPGVILKLHMGKMTVKALAGHLGVPRESVSRILNGRFGITAQMALKLAAALPKTTPESWLKLQSNYDLAEALKKEGKMKIKPIAEDQIAA
jgi:addiction module HigA family antidote